MDLFTLVARLGMDSSEYEKGISKARGSFSDLGGFISAKAVAFGTMAARSIEKATDAAINLGKSAIQAAADIEAERAQFRATFGDLQGSAEKAFKAVSEGTGIMSTRLQKVGTKAFSQFKGAGLDAADALTAMEEYTNLAADAAAYYDITLEEADERLRSFLRGNTEAGDAIGLFTSESQRNTAAMETYGKKWTALTEAQKQMLMLNVSKDIYEQSGAIGQAARESDSWTNILGNLEEAWRQASGVLGAPIKAVFTPIIQDVTEWLKDEDVKLALERFGLTAANVINAVVNFDLEDLTAFEEKAKTWWTGQGDNAYERLKSILKWTLGEFVAPSLDGVETWWGETGKPNVQGLLDWTLGELYLPAWIDMVENVTAWWTNKIKPNITRLATIEIKNIKFPAWKDVVASAVSWWSGIKSTLSEIFTINVKMSQGDTSYTPSTGGSDGVDALSGATGRIPGFATGIDYVPHNNYVARLHEGEGVLTKAENTERRNGTGSAAIDYADLGSVIGSAVREALEGAGVYMDRERVGDLVTERVSRNIAVKAQGRRFRPA